tara:strand:+ start:649 stop:1092 length:444 start_codon:yes stop_codon:yes gene_type:complete
MTLIQKISIKNYQECFILDSESINLWTLEQWELELSKRTVRAFGIYHDQKIIGLCLAQFLFQQSELNFLAIHPLFRKKGLGTTLMHKLIQQSFDENIEKIFLEVSAENKTAIDLYRKMGFETIRIRSKYYQNGSDALIQERKLFKKL